MLDILSLFAWENFCPVETTTKQEPLHLLLLGEMLEQALHLVTKNYALTTTFHSLR